MSKTTRTPIGFVDNDGYVTPYNGRIVDNMPGRYIYTQQEMDFYLGQQRLLEKSRLEQRYGVTPTEPEDVPPPPPNAVVPNPPPPPPAAVARPMDPTIPPTYENLTPEQLEQLPSGIDANQAAAKVMSKV